MQKQKGFTLIELLVTIAIVAIMAAGAAPSFGKWQEQQRFEADSQQALSLIADMRASALSDKNCEGAAALRWVAQLDEAGATLLCENIGGLETTRFFPWGSEATLSLDISGEERTTWTAETPLKISMFSGGMQSLIGDSYVNEYARITFDFSAGDKKSIVCFSRVANYPFISSESCED